MGFSSSGGAKVGTIEMWGGNTAPDGYLICDGGAISRTIYKDLFDAIGTTYGAGDGTTTFQLPNGTNVITSVNTSVPIKGNGICLGLTNGSSNVGIASTAAVYAYSNLYGKSVGTAKTNQTGGDMGLGVTTDESKSGIVGTVTRTVMTCKYIIKY